MGALGGWFPRKGVARNVVKPSSPEKKWSWMLDVGWATRRRFFFVGRPGNTPCCCCCCFVTAEQVFCGPGVTPVPPPGRSREGSLSGGSKALHMRASQRRQQKGKGATLNRADA